MECHLRPMLNFIIPVSSSRNFVISLSSRSQSAICTRRNQSTVHFSSSLITTTLLGIWDRINLKPMKFIKLQFLTSGFWIVTEMRRTFLWWRNWPLVLKGLSRRHPSFPSTTDFLFQTTLRSMTIRLSGWAINSLKCPYCRHNSIISIP